jgi:hypothetical protein
VLDWTHAHLRRGSGFARPAPSHSPAQRPPVRVHRQTWLVPVDLPVDVAVVVLEQQERACQAGRTEQALRKRWCSR